MIKEEILSEKLKETLEEKVFSLIKDYHELARIDGGLTQRESASIITNFILPLIIEHYVLCDYKIDAESDKKLDTIFEIIRAILPDAYEQRMLLEKVIKAARTMQMSEPSISEH